ncbi:MAG TPA: hypothetical protein VF627_13070 [Abditibacterium sp.]
MSYQAHEDFEDERLAAFFESASDEHPPLDWDGREEEITQDRPMLLRFAAEDADQLIVKIAELRHLARFFLEDARAALTPQLCGLAPETADLLRTQITALLAGMDEAFDGAHALEVAAVSALHEVCGDNFSFDPEEARLEANPPEATPKFKLSVECQTLRRQFFAAAKNVGLVTRREVRAARLAAIAGFVGRSLVSTGELTQAEWNSIVYAVEDGRLQW